MTTELNGLHHDSTGYLFDADDNCIGKTYDKAHAKIIAEAFERDRNKPDVPELVRYEIRMFAGKDYAEALPSPIGEYVRHDQAAALIDTQAKMYRLALSDNIQLAEKLKVAEAKLAQIKAQEPVGDLVEAVASILFHHELEADDTRETAKLIVNTIYAAPVASEKTVEALRSRAEHLEMCLRDAETQITAPVASEAETIERLRRDGEEWKEIAISDEDPDEPTSYRELSSALLSDLERYAEDETSSRRMISFNGYTEDMARLDSITRALSEKEPS